MKSTARRYKPWGLHTVRAKLRTKSMVKPLNKPGPNKRLQMPMRYFNWKLARFQASWSP